MKKLNKIFFLLGLLTSNPTFTNAQEKDFKAAQIFPDQVFEITQVIIHDVINPPAAARYYSYATLAAYLVSIEQQDKKKSSEIYPKLNKFSFERITPDKQVNIPYAASYALLEVGKRMLPSGHLLTERQLRLRDFYKKEYKLSTAAIDSSIQYAEKVASRVIEYSKTDGFSKISAHLRYTPKKTDGAWYPTPPAYIEAIEPHWTTIRPFFLDSSTQFIPPPPTPFSLDKESPFYTQQLLGVYEAVKNITKEQKETAKFWDCNPFEVKFSGHMTVGLKKITPGGHWIGITGIASKQSKLSFAKTVEAHTLIALTLHDAFISCWDEKYRSERIRPETAINKYLDESWRPILQTPPFPEYTSGHSVASSACAEILTHLFGDTYKFTDTTELLFGLPERNFTSFHQAAQEAVLSRFYGGIHYMDACEIGAQQGKEIGTFIVNKIQ